MSSDPGFLDRTITLDTIPVAYYHILLMAQQRRQGFVTLRQVLDMACIQGSIPNRNSRQNDLLTLLLAIVRRELEATERKEV